MDQQPLAVFLLPSTGGFLLCVYGVLYSPGGNTEVQNADYVDLLVFLHPDSMSGTPCSQCMALHPAQEAQSW